MVIHQSRHFVTPFQSNSCSGLGLLPISQTTATSLSFFVPVQFEILSNCSLSERLRSFVVDFKHRSLRPVLIATSRLFAASPAPAPSITRNVSNWWDHLTRLVVSDAAGRHPNSIVRHLSFLLFDQFNSFCWLSWIMIGQHYHPCRCPCHRHRPFSAAQKGSLARSLKPW
jgi:hypothetical protein